LSNLVQSRTERTDYRFYYRGVYKYVYTVHVVCCYHCFLRKIYELLLCVCTKINFYYINYYLVRQCFFLPIYYYKDYQKINWN